MPNPLRILTAAVLAALFYGTVSALAHEPLLPAPYQIDGATRFKDDRHRAGPGLGLNVPLIAVDLGTAAGAHPDAEKLAQMTFVGTGGIATGRLAGIQKHCDFLCGDSGEECHYVGLYALDGPPGGAPGQALERIGTPLAAVPGIPGLAGFRAVRPEALEAGALRLEANADFMPLTWAPYGKDGPMARVTGWDAATARLGLDLRWRWGDVFSGDGEACAASRVEGLTQLSCNPVALVLHGSRPLLLSYPDYNSAAAEVVALLDLGKTRLYLVRLGLKAQTAFGLLYRDGDGWRGLFRPRDYALLC